MKQQQKLPTGVFSQDEPVMLSECRLKNPVCQAVFAVVVVTKGSMLL